MSFTAKDLTAEKTKVLSAVRLPKDLAANTARGQYAKGLAGLARKWSATWRKKASTPRAPLKRTPPSASISTPAAGCVPFYLRCGKRLGKRVTEIAVVFKRAPHLPFEQTAVRELGKNAIVIRVQPDEGVTMRFGAKVPGGSTMEVRDVNMDFSYGRSFTENSPEAYERLILDVLLGDPPLFPTTEEVNLSWEILDPIEQFWSTLGQPQATAPVRGVRHRPTKCWRATAATGGCHDHRYAEHPHPRDCAQNRTAARGARRIGDRPRADAAHRHRGRGPRACAGNRELGQP